MSPAGEKYDIKKAARELYAPPAGRFVEVDVPPQHYLAGDGAGDPIRRPPMPRSSQRSTRSPTR
ncbi:hypothetical protein [Paramicrobacterium humi]|uniref:hypothetical protein n=1 Tax=Paramicrobacterium humi TaxID=640635 RepID=UPI001FE080FC|nr:hypothetical protein [Microbacterium humi]